MADQVRTVEPREFLYKKMKRNSVLDRLGKSKVSKTTNNWSVSYSSKLSSWLTLFRVKCHTTQSDDEVDLRNLSLWLAHTITYKVFQSEQPSYLHSLLIVQSCRTTHSPGIITLQRPSGSNCQVFYPPCSFSLEFSTQTTAAAFGISITRHCYWFFSTCPVSKVTVLASVSH